MSGSAILSRSNDTLFLAIAKVAARLAAEVKKHFAATVAAVDELVTDRAQETHLRKLYRLSASSDTVTPQLLAALREDRACAV